MKDGLHDFVLRYSNGAIPDSWRETAWGASRGFSKLSGCWIEPGMWPAVMACCVLFVIAAAVISRRLMIERGIG